jgi:heme-degrading monooxygenase HmoA
VIVRIVRFRNVRSLADVLRTIGERHRSYEAAPGLIRTKAVLDLEAGEYGEITMWESEGALRAFRASLLAGSASGSHEIAGEPRDETLEVLSVVRPRERASVAG